MICLKDDKDRRLHACKCNLVNSFRLVGVVVDVITIRAEGCGFDSWADQTGDLPNGSPPFPTFPYCIGAIFMAYYAIALLTSSKIILF